VRRLALQARKELAQSCAELFRGSLGPCQQPGLWSGCCSLFRISHPYLYISVFDQIDNSSLSVRSFPYFIARSNCLPYVANWSAFYKRRSASSVAAIAFLLFERTS